MTKQVTYCCEHMRREVEFACEAHPDLNECPDSLIVRRSDSGEFGLRVHDGGSSYVTIRHCPWCGADLVEGVSNKELGLPSLRVASFQLWVHGRQFPDAQDADDGNWLRVTGHCGASGASIWVQGSILMVTDIERFGRECRSLYEGKSDRAGLEPFEPVLRIGLKATDQTGHIRADVEITPEHLTQKHRMQFEIDQSYLPEIIEQCAAVVTAYPVRGRPGPAQP
jgi:hypothetical protein